MALSIPLPAEEVTQCCGRELHNLEDHAERDLHKIKLLNHLAMIIFSTLLAGVVTGWEIRDLLLSGSIGLPTLIMEIFDYAGKL